jgi:hypothetical protein
MAPRNLGITLLSMSGVAFVIVCARLVWFAKSYTLGFDLPGIWRMWGRWILHWLLIATSGLALLRWRRPG